MISQSIIPIEELVRHSYDMSLLDAVTSENNKGLEAIAEVKLTNPFLDDRRVPSWLCIEYMAQTIAAWAGSQARKEGREIGLGFLVGTRKFKANFEYIPLGTVLHISVKKELYNETGISVFSSFVTSGAMKATANINVFQPANLADFLDSNS